MIYNYQGRITEFTSKKVVLGKHHSRTYKRKITAPRMKEFTHVPPVIEPIYFKNLNLIKKHDL